jgi:hypothetical protein
MQSLLTRPFDEIRNVNVGREVWKLPVRIVNIWYVRDYLKHKHIEMVLMDSNVSCNIFIHCFTIFNFVVVFFLDFKIFLIYILFSVIGFKLSCLLHMFVPLVIN